MSETRAVAELSYAYESSPAGRTVEVVSGPDADGMVQVRYVAPFHVSIDDLEFWGDAK